MTRDRVAYDAQWAGRRFTIVDTGGWAPDARDRAAAIAAQAEIAAADRRRGPVRGRRHGRRARRGRGRGADAAAHPQAGDPGRQQGRQRPAGDRVGVAVVARPRPAVPGLGPARPRLRRPARRDAGRAARAAAGHSSARPARPAPGGPGRPAQRRQVVSLLNRLAKEERAVVDSVAGTTVDPVDSLVEHRRRDLAASSTPPACAAGSPPPAAPSTTRACAPPARSRRPRWRWCCSTPASRSASRTSGSSSWSTEAGRALVHRVQQVGPGRRRTAATTWTRRSTASCAGSRGRSGSTSRPRPAGRWTSSRPALRQALASWEQRVPTGQLNQCLTAVVQAHPAPGPRRPGAAGPVRDPGRHPAAAVRAVHHRAARRRLRPVRRAQAARGVRLRGHARSTSRSARASGPADACLRARTVSVGQGRGSERE